MSQRHKNHRQKNPSTLSKTVATLFTALAINSSAFAQPHPAYTAGQQILQQCAEKEATQKEIFDTFTECWQASHDQFLKRHFALVPLEHNEEYRIMEEKYHHQVQQCKEERTKEIGRLQAENHLTCDDRMSWREIGNSTSNGEYHLRTGTNVGEFTMRFRHKDPKGTIILYVIDKDYDGITKDDTLNIHYQSTDYPNFWLELNLNITEQKGYEISGCVKDMLSQKDMRCAGVTTEDNTWFTRRFAERAHAVIPLENINAQYAKLCEWDGHGPIPIDMQHIHGLMAEATPLAVKAYKGGARLSDLKKGMSKLGEYAITIGEEIQTWIQAPSQ